MGIKCSCPHCNRGMNLMSSLGGKKGRCPQCGGIFLIPLNEVTNLRQEQTGMADPSNHHLAQQDRTPFHSATARTNKLGENQDRATVTSEVVIPQLRAKRWFIFNSNGSQEPPISDIDLVLALRQGRIAPSTKVWNSNSNCWTVVSEACQYLFENNALSEKYLSHLHNIFSNYISEKQSHLLEIERSIENCDESASSVSNTLDRLETAKFFGPMITCIDTWPLYIFFLVICVGLTSLSVFGLLLTTSSPAWLAAIFSIITAIGSLRIGKQLLVIEREIRHDYNENLENELTRFQTLLHQHEETRNRLLKSLSLATSEVRSLADEQNYLMGGTIGRGQSFNRLGPKRVESLRGEKIVLSRPRWEMLSRIVKVLSTWILLIILMSLIMSYSDAIKTFFDFATRLLKTWFGAIYLTCANRKRSWETSTNSASYSRNSPTTLHHLTQQCELLSQNCCEGRRGFW